MWYITENGDNIRPAEIDTTSSHVYFYIRRNIEHIPEKDDMPAHYRWEEAKITKDMLPIIEKFNDMESEIINTQLALCELYEEKLV